MHHKPLTMHERVVFIRGIVDVASESHFEAIRSAKVRAV